MPDPIFPGPHESVHNVAFNKRRVTGKPHDIASLIDCRGRVPPISSKIADISHPTIFPKHGVPGCMSSDGLIAYAGNAHDLTIVIYRRGGSVSGAGGSMDGVTC